jgi:hypothetical protein
MLNNEYARVPLAALALVAFAWGVWTFPIFWHQSSDESIARQIISGNPYQLEALLHLKQDLEVVEQSSYCRASATRSVAIIRLRIAEQTILTGDTKSIDNEFDALRKSLLGTLSCSPADPFSWLALFWLDNIQDGFSTKTLSYLRLSYRLGANEGWIALKRNHISFSIFEALEPDLAEMTIREFLQLLSTGLYVEVADILTGPAWRVRESILPRLTQVPLRNREILATVLRNRGNEISVPGVLEQGFNPWR